jgi:hypothetical protein
MLPASLPTGQPCAISAAIMAASTWCCGPPRISLPHLPLLKAGPKAALLLSWCAGWILQPNIRVTKLFFSDGQWWLGRTTQKAANIASRALGLVRATRFPSNIAKMHYAHLTCTPDHRMRRISTAVLVLGEFLTSSRDCPLVVCIPLEPNALSPTLATSFFGAFSIQGILSTPTTHLFL